MTLSKTEQLASRFGDIAHRNGVWINDGKILHEMARAALNFADETIGVRQLVPSAGPLERDEYVRRSIVRQFWRFCEENNFAPLYLPAISVTSYPSGSAPPWADVEYRIEVPARRLEVRS